MPRDRRRRRRGRALGLGVLGVFVLALVLATVFDVGPLAGATIFGPAQGPTAPADPFATAAMKAFLRHRQGHIGAAIYDIASGATYLYHADRREQTASIVKVDILATLLHEQQAEGEGLSYDEGLLATGMIEQSDNDDANALWGEVGGAAGVGAFDRSIGMTETTPNDDGYWGETLTSARDQIRLLRDVFLRNDTLHYGARDYERYLMENVTPFEDWGVSAGPPRGVTVALKNGWVPIVGDDWQVNSIGMISGDGRHYLLAVLTDGDDGEGYGIQTIEGISRIVWRTLPHAARER